MNVDETGGKWVKVDAIREGKSVSINDNNCLKMLLHLKIYLFRNFAGVEVY